MIVKKLLPAALCGVSLSLSSVAAADNAVAPAVQRLHLSPQQLLSLRDFLGSFNHGLAVEASGNGLFVLRDARSMAYAGEFALRTDGSGTLTVDRINGPATLNMGRNVQVPMRLDAKARLQATATLSGSQALSAEVTGSTGLPAQQVAGAALIDSAQAASVLQLRAVFFRDGSGYTAALRAQLGQAHSGPPTLLRIAERYYAAITSDGKQAWRTAIAEIDGDVALGFAELESRYSCPSLGACVTRSILPVPASPHVIRWGRQDIASVPVTLLAQLAPTPQTLAAPDAAAPAAPDASAPQTPAPDIPPAPGDTTLETPPHPNGA
jgi:hypothetical protein